MISRREAVQSLAGGALTPVLLSRADAQVTSDLVRYRPEIEPLVALIEQTPRERSAEFLADQLRKGVAYRQLMAALFLAGVRNINPRPPGFALHCVFVIHSAHLMGLEAPPDSRLLPLFYAMDNFKAAQLRDSRGTSGDFAMRAIGGTLPAAEKAASELTSALEAWDIERAERAVVSLARHRPGSEVVGMLRKYGARDYRNIGHKAIYVANAFRTLEVIGWQDAEPVLRSLVLALLDFGVEQQVNGYKFEDQCYNSNLKLLKDAFPRLPANWAKERAGASVTRAMLDEWRKATPEEICQSVAARLLKKETGADAVWDAVHLSAAELAMRARGPAALVAIHSVTSANALHHAYSTSSSPEMRFLLLLQGAGWMGQFRTWAESREQNLRPVSIASLEPAAAADLDTALAATFAGIPSDVDASAARVFRFAGDRKARQAFLTTALRTTLAKAEEVHYYKYLAALIEDVDHVSPEWQPHLLATIVYYLKGSNDSDSATMKRAREAVQTLPA